MHTVTVLSLIITRNNDVTPLSGSNNMLNKINCSAYTVIYRNSETYSITNILLWRMLIIAAVIGMIDSEIGPERRCFGEKAIIMKCPNKAQQLLRHLVTTSATFTSTMRGPF